MVHTLLYRKTLSADNIVSKGLSVNGNVTAAKLQPYDTAGLIIDLNACTLTCTDAVTSPQIIMSSPVLANILTVNTIRSADATNLTINSPGGTVLTNATNITASGALALNSTNSRLSLNAGTNIVYVSSPTTFANNIACSNFINGSTNNIEMCPLTGSINLLTNNANNINITPGTTAITSFGGGGIKLPNGGSTLNWYEEATLTGTWYNVLETTPSVTLYITRIGKQVFITMSSASVTPSGSIALPTFSVILPTKFYPIAQINQSNYNGNVNPYTIRITTAGVILMQTYTVNATITPIMNFSYYSNAVTGSPGGATGQDNGNGDSGASGQSDPGTSSDITGGSDTPGSGEPKP